MTPKLKTEFWVTALVRRAQSQGAFATILRKGDPDAGITLIVVRTEANHLTLYAPERDMTGRRIWWPSPISEQSELDMRLNQRVDEDPDIWIVEIETQLPITKLLDELIGGEEINNDPALLAAKALFREG